MISLGVPISGGVPSSKLEILNDGEEIPIEIHDGGDGVLNSGDYIQFVGYPPKPSPYCSTNIYNVDNVYWFSYESETPPDTFKVIDGFPRTINKKIESTLYHFIMKKILCMKDWDMHRMAKGISGFGGVLMVRREMLLIYLK